MEKELHSGEIYTLANPETILFCVEKASCETDPIKMLGLLRVAGYAMRSTKFSYGKVNFSRGLVEGLANKACESASNPHQEELFLKIKDEILKAFPK